MIILGLSTGADASAAVVADGRLVAAVQQERIDRVRHSAAFPSGALDAALDVAGLRARDVDRVVIAVPSGPGEGGTLSAAARKSGLFMLGHELTRRRYEGRVREQGMAQAAVEVMEADRAQASCAFRTQPDDAVLVVVVDGADGAAVSVSLARHGQLDRLFSQTSYAGLAALPRAVAAHLGTEPPRLGMLAAGAEAPAELVRALVDAFGFDGTGFRAVRPGRVAARIAALAGDLAPAVLAAATLATEAEAARAFVAAWARRTGATRVVLGGRWFADPRLVGALADTPGVTVLRVSPGLGAPAAAIGAALGAAGTAPAALPTLALGPSFDDAACYRALSNANLPRTRVDDPEAVAAEHIAAGRTVARFADGLPLGGRPWGCRSVLFSVTDPEAGPRALEALKRPTGAPVACLVTAAHLDAVARVPASVRDDLRLGAVAVPAADAFDQRCPGAVHRDGTVLPTVVDTDRAPLHHLLAEVERRTGAYAVGEVSFSPVGVPMVCTPTDAVRAFRTSRVDVLLLGAYLLEREAIAPSRSASRQKDAKPTQSSDDR